MKRNCLSPVKKEIELCFIKAECDANWKYLEKLELHIYIYIVILSICIIMH